MAKLKKKKFKKAAGGLGKLWKTAKKQMAEEGDIFGIEVDDGPYIASLTDAQVKESAAGWNYVDWEFTVLEGESEDSKVSRRSGIETEENLVWLMRDFNRFGLDPDEIELDNKKDLQEVLDQIVAAEPKCRIVCKTNDAGMQNVYINKVLEIEETSDNGDGDAGFEEGDRVSVDIDGTDYEGNIVSVADDKAEIEFDDGDKGTYDFSEITKLDAVEPGEDELSKGDRVEAEVNGTDYPGEITKIKGDQITVKFDDGDVETVDASVVTKIGGQDAGDWLGEQAGYKKGKKMFVGKIIAIDTKENTFTMKTDADKKVTGDIDDLEKAETEPEEPELAKGDRVSADIDGTTYEGTIKKVEDDKAIITFDDGDELTKDLDELTKLEPEAEKEPEDGDTGELNVGDKVEVDYKGKEMIGTVKKIDEEKEEVTVLLKKTKQKIKVPVDKITILG